VFRLSCSYLTATLLALILTACSINGQKWNPDDYTVKSGDTVYSIAWRYEIDPEQFTDWNNIKSNIIKPGQRLHTRKPHNFVSSRKAETTYSGKVAYAPKRHSSTQSSYKSYSNQKWVKAVKGDSLYKISKKTGVSTQRLIQLNQLKKPYVIQPGQTIFIKELQSSGSSRTKTVKKKTTATPRVSSKQKPTHRKTQTVSWPKTVKWKRPTKGRVVKKFNRHRIDAKGIKYKGKRGDAILAAADGKVVYSGNGLISYGNLIIIKHNKTYISAYAYNRKLLVKEGDIVKAGQKVAEMGNKDKQGPRLHFEIRKNGKPVDPLKYLPW
jgi:lipoprotein NlpD